MTKEQEKETIKYLEFLQKEYLEDAKRKKENGEITGYGTMEDIDKLRALYIGFALDMLKEKDKEIENLKENIDYQTLCDFLISSVAKEEKPVWTEEQIEELLENFEVRWKDAYKQDS